MFLNGLAPLEETLFHYPKVQEDHELLRDSGEVPISEWSGKRFDSRCEHLLSAWPKEKEKEKTN